MHGVGVAEAGLVVLERSDPRTSSAPRRSRRSTRRASSRGTASASASSAASSQLTMPRSIGRLRPMSSCAWSMRMYLRVGPERELADRRHAVLADQDHQVGAGQRAGRGVGRQRAGVRELALHRAGLDDRNLRLLGEALQRIPRLGVEHAVARHDDRPLAPCGSGRRPWRCPSATDAAASRCDSATCRGRTRARWRP